MTGMGVNEHQAMHFTGLLEVASWVVEKFDSFDNAFEFMIRKLESGAGDMATAASVFTLPEPAIRILLQLTDKTLKYFIPPDFRPDPFVPASNSIGILGQYFEHFAGSTARAVEFSKGRAGKTAGYRMWGLILDFEQIESVEQDMERGWKTEASNRLNGIANVRRADLNGPR